MKKSIKRSIAVLCFALSLSSCAVNAVSEGDKHLTKEQIAEREARRPKPEFIRRIKSIITQSSYISVKYFELGTTISPSKDIVALNRSWDHLLIKNCFQSCLSKPSIKRLEQMLTQSWRADESCPVPLGSAIEFLDSDKNIIETVYVHQTGHCFQLGIDGIGYTAVPTSINRFIEQFWEDSYPDINGPPQSHYD